MGRNLVTGRPEELLREKRGEPISVIAEDSMCLAMGFDPSNTDYWQSLKLYSGNDTRASSLEQGGLYLIQAFVRVALAGGDPLVHWKICIGGDVPDANDPVLNVANISGTGSPGKPVIFRCPDLNTTSGVWVRFYAPTAASWGSGEIYVIRARLF